MSEKFALVLLVAGLVGHGAPPCRAQTDCPDAGLVLAEAKISANSANLSGLIQSEDRFGYAMTSLGDFDGDGVSDIAVGAISDDDGGVDRGAVWLLLLHSDGAVKEAIKISQTSGNFAGPLDDFDHFGHAVACIGDLNGDGTVDLAVGATEDDDGGSERGAVWILFLAPDGTVGSTQKISSTQGGFAGPLLNATGFGGDVAPLGDLDGDGITDIAVGAWRDRDGGPGKGAVWVLFLNADGTVKSHQKISSTSGGFGGLIDPEDQFGIGVAAIGDLDGDGVADLAVGANEDDDGGGNRGAVWILFLNSDGTVKSEQKISDLAGSFNGQLDDGDQFGIKLAALGDLDGDLVPDLAVGANFDGDGGFNRGAVWILLLNPDGTVKAHQKISSTSGGFAGPLDNGDAFGYGVAKAGDLDGDGHPELAVGAYGDDDGAFDVGAVWILSLDSCGPPQPCDADLSGDSVLDFFDVAGFLQFFSLHDERADWTHDGVFDFFDVMAFLQDFAAGCD